MSKKRKVFIIILLNLMIVALEIFFGIHANSIALLTDAVHNLGDVLAVIITFIAINLSARKATENMTFGFIRAEMMAGFINSLFLSASMLYLIIESIKKIINPEEVASEYMIFVAAIALVANVISAVLLQRMGIIHTHGRHDGQNSSKAHEDLNIKSAFLHMIADAFVSFGVIVGGVTIYYYGIGIIDPIFSLLFSLYILKEAVKILKKTFFSLLDINSDDIASIEKLILDFDKVYSVHDLHLYRPSSKEMLLSTHIVFSHNLTLVQIEEILKKIRFKLKSAGITHSVLQPETINMNQDNILCSNHD